MAINEDSNITNPAERIHVDKLVCTVKVNTYIVLQET